MRDKWAYKGIERKQMDNGKSIRISKKLKGFGKREREKNEFLPIVLNHFQSSPPFILKYLDFGSSAHKACPKKGLPHFGRCIFHK